MTFKEFQQINHPMSADEGEKRLRTMSSTVITRTKR